MKRLVFLLFLIAAVAGFSGIKEVYEKNLADDYKFMNADINLQQKNYQLYKENFFFVPSFTTSVDTFTYSKSGFIKQQLSPDRSVNINFNLSFIQVFGAKAGITLPLNYDPDKNEWTWKELAVSISRSLFTEFYLDKPAAEKELYDARNTYEAAKWSVLISTIQDIFNYHNAIKGREIAKKKLDILQRQYEKETDKIKKDSLMSQIITMQKSMFNYDTSIKSINTGFSDDLYLQCTSFYEILKVPGKASYDDIYKKRNEVKSMELQDNINNQKSFWWFLPYLPNPSFSVTINPFKDFDWKVSVNFQYNIFDNFSNIIESMVRSEGQKVTKLQLESVKETIRNSVDKIYNDFEISKLDLKQKDMDLNNSKEDYNKATLLYTKKFLKEDDYRINELDFMIKELDYQKAIQACVLNILNIYKESGNTVEAVTLEKIN